MLMLFARKERCSRFGRFTRWRRAEIDVISLFSRLSVVIEFGSGHEMTVSWLEDAVREVSAGNREATAAIYIAD